MPFLRDESILLDAIIRSTLTIDDSIAGLGQTGPRQKPVDGFSSIIIVHNVTFMGFDNTITAHLNRW
jgi:hypothetical protein